MTSAVWIMTGNRKFSLLTPTHSFKGEISQGDRLWYFVFFLDCHRGNNQDLPLNSIPLEPLKLDLVLDYWNPLYAAKKCLFWSGTHLPGTISNMWNLTNLFSGNEKITPNSSPHWSLLCSDSPYVNIMCAHVKDFPIFPSSFWLLASFSNRWHYPAEQMGCPALTRVVDRNESSWW